MPPAKTVSRTSKGTRGEIARTITTPLGFYVLALLIVESTLAIVLSTSKLSEDHVWQGFQWMIWVFCGVVVAVTLFAFFKPKNLLYGKEEHSDPALEPSALTDSVESLIRTMVKPECLKDSRN